MTEPVKMPQKKKLTEDERAALAKKLDDDLEQFMEEMAAKKAGQPERKKPFDFDEWCKEIDQHPAFMKEISRNEDGEYSETVQALQAMKYSEDDDEDKVSTAENHKKEGNKQFGFKKYRWATDCYTNGIKVNCPDRKLNAVLHFNRAAAQKHLGNLRSAIKDCTMGRRFDPSNLKGVIRGAECLIELNYGKDALHWIEVSKYSFAFQKETSSNTELSEEEKKQIDTLEELRKKAVEVAVVEERNHRKNNAIERKEIENKKVLLDALVARNLNLNPRLPFNKPELMDWALLDVSLPLLHSHERVKFDDENNLIWPVLLQYPEEGKLDVLTETNETTMLGVLLREVLSTPADWDTDFKYKFEEVRFFVSDQYEESLTEVFEWNEFKYIFSLPGYQIKQGMPVFTKECVDELFVHIGGEDQNKFLVK